MIVGFSEGGKKGEQAANKSKGIYLSSEGAECKCIPDSVAYTLSYDHPVPLYDFN